MTIADAEKLLEARYLTCCERNQICKGMPCGFLNGPRRRSHHPFVHCRLVANCNRLGDRIFPEFLKLILADYKIRDNKFHIAGAFNGGIAAWHVAAGNPQYFLSVTAFPGYMWEPSAAKLEAISKMCFFMYVGEHDSYIWHGEMKWEAHFLRERGTVVRYGVEEGQPHRMEKDQSHGIETLAGANAGRLFDGFEEISKGCSR